MPSRRILAVVLTSAALALSACTSAGSDSWADGVVEAAPVHVARPWWTSRAACPISSVDNRAVLTTRRWAPPAGAGVTSLVPLSGPYGDGWVFFDERGRWNGAALWNVRTGEYHVDVEDGIAAVFVGGRDLRHARVLRIDLATQDVRTLTEGSLSRATIDEGVITVTDRRGRHTQYDARSGERLASQDWLRRLDGRDMPYIGNGRAAQDVEQRPALVQPAPDAGLLPLLPTRYQLQDVPTFHGDLVLYQTYGSGTRALDLVTGLDLYISTDWAVAGEDDRFVAVVPAASKFGHTKTSVLITLDRDRLQPSMCRTPTPLIGPTSQAAAEPAR